MIKFFRKIRHKLLSENKFSKYLLYAIGEIVLVVIGILIALQINGYNQYLNDRIEEKEILIRFETDLKKDLDQISFDISFNERLIESLKNFINSINENTLTLEFFIKGSDALSSLGGYDKTLGTYNEVISSGNMSLILNNELRDRIIKFYQPSKAFAADPVNDHFYQNTILPYVNQSFGYTSEYVSMATQEPNNFEPFDLEAVYENREFRSILATKLLLVQAQIKQLDWQKKDIESIVQNIQDEVKARWSE